MSVSVRRSLGKTARFWGLRTNAGFRYTAPTRIRAIVARRHCDVVGSGLSVATGLQVVNHTSRATLHVGSRVTLREHVRLMFEGAGQGSIIIGDQVFINARSEIRSAEQISIGNCTVISFDVTLIDTDVHQIVGSDRSAPITIGANVWIGAHAMILKGVRVGDGAVVAAGAVVTRDVPARALVVGTPAKVVRDDVAWTP